MEEEQNISRKLETMIPLDVHQGLTSFARSMTKTGLGKYDYGVAIRILLERAETLKAFEILSQRITDMESKLEKLEQEEEKPKEEVSTFGNKKKK